MSRATSRVRSPPVVAAALLVVVAAAVALVAAVVPRASAGADPTSCAAATPAGGATYGLEVPAGPLPMRVLVHVPRRPAGRRLPLVLAFHGAGADGAQFRRYSGLAALADRAGFAVAFPTAPAPTRSWQLFDQPGSGRDDVAAVGRALDAVLGRSCVDPGRVFATGVSNGGGFTARLGCALPERIAGIAPVAGGYRAVARCPAGRPVSVLEIHGTEDHVVPYRGGEETDFRGAVLPYLRVWAARDGCGPHGIVTRRPGVLVRWRWAGCAPGIRVRHVAIVGGRHSWSGGTPRDAGPNPLSAAEEVWRFFRSPG
ncbi:alpha/beta hydrolase family esterase [Patulibacter minatonensis]|uniref:alpha/beta hydrolase family esterase n=1 Tax=Patulibacter minatonensis TaxID=298163 RepID=UPI0004AFA85C|nr:PHB depolymerase family esterase [Patulibacter minatonensis]